MTALRRPLRNLMPDTPDPQNIHSIDVSAIPMLMAFERYGARIDVGNAGKLERYLDQEMERAAAECIRLAGMQFDVSSDDDYARVLFEELGLPSDDLKSTKSKGRPSVGKDELAKIEHLHPVIGERKNFKEAQKLKGTYAHKLPKLVDSDGRIRPDFLSTRTETGRLACKDPNCFDKHTEVLTRYGWMPFRIAYLGQPEVMQYTSDGQLEFVQPTAWQQVATTRAVTIKSEQIDLRVTPDHRCLLQHRKNGSLQIFEAWKYPEDWKQLHGGQYYGSGLPLTCDEIRLLVAIQADGFMTDCSIVDFGFTKQRKLERLKQILDACLIEYRDGSKANRLRVYARCKSFAVKWLGSGKKFGSWLLKMNKQQLDVFCEEVFHWDGCYTRMNHYASRVRSNAEWVQTMLALNGNRARLRRYMNQGGSESWQVDVTRRNYTLTTNRELMDEDLEEPETFYCCSVPSSYLLVRRGQNIMVTGQCQNIPARTEMGRRVKELFIPSPGCVLAEVDYSQIELRCTAHVSEDAAMIEVYRTGDDLHWRTAESAYRAPRSELGKEQRQASKTTNFLTIYRGTAPALLTNLISDGADRNYWTEELVQTILIDGFYRGYPGVTRMNDESDERLRKHGYTWDMFGRVRHGEAAWSAFEYVRSEAFRQCGNMRIQGACASLLKLGFAPLLELCNTFCDMGYRCWPILSVHDSMLFDVSEEIVGYFLPEAKQIMESLVEWRVPIVAEAEVGENWGVKQKWKFD